MNNKQITLITEDHNSKQFGNETIFCIEDSNQNKIIDLVVHAIQWIMKRNLNNDIKGFSKTDWSRCGEVQDNMTKIEWLLEKIETIKDGSKVSLTMWTKW